MKNATHSRPKTTGSWESPYLYGIDLYNYGYWWEAHEAFETLWRQTQNPLTRQFLQGLIKICGAYLKWQQQNRRGMMILFKGAMQHFSCVMEKEKSFMGIDLQHMVRAWQQHFESVQQKRKDSGSVSWTQEWQNHPYLILTNKKNPLLY